MEDGVDIDSLYKGLSLTEEESKRTLPLVPRAPTVDHRSLLVGKILAPRRIPADAVQNCFSMVWKSELKVKTLANNVYQLAFPNPGLRNRVLASQPWVFGDHHLMILRESRGDMVAAEIEFTHVPFWIIAYKPTQDQMTFEAARDIGNGIGRFLDVDRDRDGEITGEFLRIRVEIDLRKPLKRVQIPPGATNLLPLRYEKLPDFCGFCGIIGHVRNKCLVRREAPEDQRDSIPYPEQMSIKPWRNPFPDSRNTKTQAAGVVVQAKEDDRSTSPEITARHDDFDGILQKQMPHQFEDRAIMERFRKDFVWLLEPGIWGQD